MTLKRKRLKLLAIQFHALTRVSVRILLNVKEGTSSLTQKKCKLFRDMLKDTKMEEYPKGGHILLNNPKGGHILLNINFSTEVKEDVPSLMIFVSFRILLSAERRQLIRSMLPPFEIKVGSFALRRMCPP